MINDTDCATFSKHCHNGCLKEISPSPFTRSLSRTYAVKVTNGTEMFSLLSFISLLRITSGKEEEIDKFKENFKAKFFSDTKISGLDLLYP